MTDIEAVETLLQLPANERADMGLRLIMQSVREDAVAKVLRPYAEKYHPGYIRSVGIEMSERVMACAATAPARRRLQAFYDSRDYPAMVAHAVNTERKALRRVSREVVRTKLRADTHPRGFSRILRIANLIFRKVG